MPGFSVRPPELPRNPKNHGEGECSSFTFLQAFNRWFGSSKFLVVVSQRRGCTPTPPPVLAPAISLFRACRDSGFVSAFRWMANVACKFHPLQGPCSFPVVYRAVLQFTGLQGGQRRRHGIPHPASGNLTEPQVSDAQGSMHAAHSMRRGHAPLLTPSPLPPSGEREAVTRAAWGTPVLPMQSVPEG